tara:strand:+ start:19849 stop:20841 length:993 start_codon:yes stop_codon:yes gene_type:complete
MRILITGCAGFIGSAASRYFSKKEGYELLGIDSLSYAANFESISHITNRDNFEFKQFDIRDKNFFSLIKDFEPEIVLHFAAESHVDNSIDAPDIFIDTNIFGSYNLLKSCTQYFKGLSSKKQEDFIYFHVSTDEVYGDLEIGDDPFTEKNNYLPSSPYSASKASSDMLSMAWQRTYSLPVIIGNCSNNYGPFQNQEKFIPKIISNCIKKIKIPVYGDGQQIRDWLFVDDHIMAIEKILSLKEIGEKYNIGGNNEIKNIDVIKIIMQKLCDKGVSNFEELSHLIDYVDDRPGHDRRYAIDSTKLMKKGWMPLNDFDSGISKTIDWYLDDLS